MADKSKVEKKIKKNLKLLQGEPTEEEPDGGAGNPLSDWGSCLKFLQTSTTPASHANVCAIVKLVKDSEQSLLSHSAEYECFYSAFIALATHHVCSSFTSLNKSELNDFVSTCRIIVAYILQRLSNTQESCCLSKVVNSFNPNYALERRTHSKQLMILLVALCRGAGPTGCLSKSDIAMIVSQLKTAKVPAACTSSDSTTQDSGKGRKSPELPGGHQAVNIADIYAELTSVLDEIPVGGGGGVEGGRIHHLMSRRISTTGPADPQGETLHLDDPPSTRSDGGIAMKELIQMKNVSSLQQSGGGERLLEVCSSLIYLKKYRQMFSDAIKSSASPPVTSAMNHTDALNVRASLHSVLGDVSVVWRVFSLPVLEPLTRERLEQIVAVAMSCLHAALSAAEATSVMNMGVSGGGSGGAQGGTTGLTRATSTSAAREEEMDGQASAIINKTLDIMNWVLSAAKNSSRGGGQVVQNLKMFFCWASLRGLSVLQHHCTVASAAAVSKVTAAAAAAAAGKTGSKESVAATADGSKAKHSAEKSHTGSLKSHTAGKLHAGFGPFSVSLASQMIRLLTSLMNDVHTESLTEKKGKVDVGSEAEGRVATLTLFGEFSGVERIRLLLKSVSLSSLLLFLLSQSYKKAALLSRLRAQVNKSTVAAVTASALDDILMDLSSDARSSASSDSNTFYEEDFSNSDDSNDDDSEPILGLWFEETLSAKDSVQQQGGKSEGQGGGASDQSEAGPGSGGGARQHSGRHHSGTSDQLSYSPTERNHPDSYIRFAIDVLNMIGQHLLNSSCAELRNYISRSSLTEEHLTYLSTLVRDMDSDNYTSTACSLYGSFSSSVAHFLHTLIVTNSLSDTLQETLLDQLGVSLAAECNTWPLHVRPRTLTLLAEILLLRQRDEKLQEESGSGAASTSSRRQSDVIIIHIWTRFIDTLTNAFIQADNSLSNYTDVNVEHMQLLVFLFHGLALMQKKSLWVQLCQAIQKIADHLKNKTDGKSLDSCSPLPLTRLLLIFDYVLHYFYDRPQVLITQVQYNMFGVYAGRKSDGTSAADDKDTSKRYFLYSELEEQWQEHSGSNKGSTEMKLKPKLYSLGPSEYNIQDVPKVDGLACSFMLNNPEQLDYDKFYAAVESLLFAGTNRVSSAEEKIAVMESCYLHYHTSVCWKILVSLPPSKEFFNTLTSLPLKSTPLITDPTAYHAHILNTLHWLSRVGHKQFYTWMKDYLMKQGGATQVLVGIESFIKTRGFQFNLVTYYVNNMMSLMLSEQLDYVEPRGMPLLSGLYALDALVARTHYNIAELIQAVGSPLSEKEQELLTFIKSLMSTLQPFIHSLNVFARSGLLHRAQFTPTGEAGTSKSTPSTDSTSLLPPSVLSVYNAAFKIFSSKTLGGKVNPLGQAIQPLIPYTVYPGSDKAPNNDFPAPMAWKSTFATDAVPLQSYMEAVQCIHLKKLSTHPSHAVVVTVKHVLHGLVKFLTELYFMCPNSSTTFPTLSSSVLAVHFDVTSDHYSDYLMDSVDKLLGSSDSEAYQFRVVDLSIHACYDIIMNRLQISTESGHCGYINERMIHECLTYMESSLESTGGKSALQKYFLPNNGFIKILLSTAQPPFGTTYATKVLNFFNRLLQLADKNPTDEQYKSMCLSLRGLATLDPSELQNWLTQMILPTPTSTTSSPSTGTTVPPPPPLVSGSKSGSSPGSNISSVSHDDKLVESRLLLQSLTASIVKGSSHVGEEVTLAILNSLVPMGSIMLNAGTFDSSSTGFVELMVVMTMLAGSGSGVGHATLFRAAIDWLDRCKAFLAQKDVAEKLEAGETDGKHQLMIDSAVCLLAYIKDVLNALKQTVERSCGGSSSPVCGEVDVRMFQDVDSDTEDCMQDDEESLADDSDDESLNNKLCTYTVTQKEFMNQHWYHCHTCKMVDGVGVCTVCARVCHKDHDLSYAKLGSFFCDCGAKEDRRCMALTKRTGTGASGGMASAGGAPVDQSNNGGASDLTTRARQLSATKAAVRSAALAAAGLLDATKDLSGDKSSDKSSSKSSEAFLRQIQGCKDALLTLVGSSGLDSRLTGLLQFLRPSLNKVYEDISVQGGSLKAQQALKELRDSPKETVNTDYLMVMATLGSQEGAFENVRISYSGDQGQTIRQLITSHVLRRVGMCCLTSPYGRRQHLAVCNEKGKVMILQLSALFKQSQTNKRKLTLTRLSSASIPFTVLSLAGSPANEDFLAVCGLKDCHVLTFNNTGQVADHLVLHPSLETGNFIIKAVWLPGSQTELAIVTADFVKVYDLAADALSPQYYFLLPTGKIRDVTFVYIYPDKPNEDCEIRTSGGLEPKRHLLVMGSSGYVYSEVMDGASSARHGPFYMTNVLDIKHSDIKESNGQVGGGGVSIYYSHTLQLLFFSYSQGKSFIAPLQKQDNTIAPELPTLFPISLKTGNGGKSGVSSGSGTSGSGNGQALVQWMEVHNHPGLVCCLTQTSNNPVVMMIKPDSILVQEIKGLSAKAKIQDIVVIRHMGSGMDPRTTLILLCEDGSLRIYIANVEQTNFWMSPALQARPSSVQSSSAELFKPLKRKKNYTSGRVGGSGQVTFSVDFFEHCQATNDIEFGGSDVLHVYNVQQVKHRLNTTGLYIASTKPGGFSMEVSNTSSSTVMVGIRILLGSQTIERAPSFVEIFGRRIPISLTRHRWFDMPFAREEALTADKKFTIGFGPSADPVGVTMVDSVKVYTKTKEQFGWLDDADEMGETAGGQAKSSGGPSGGGYVSVDSESPCGGAGGMGAMASPLTSLDRLIGNAVEVLDGCLILGNADEKSTVKSTALQLSTQLLTLATPGPVQHQTKSLMSSLFNTRSSYHWHKDEAQLDGAVKCLTTFYESGEINAESYNRLISVARAVAVSRPYNLTRFSEQWTHRLSPASAKDKKAGDKSSARSDAGYMKLSVAERRQFVVQLCEAFWYLHSVHIENPLTTPVCVSGLSHIESVVTALVEILHAFSLDSSNSSAASSTSLLDQQRLQHVPLLCKLYARMLLSEDKQVSFVCKQVLVRLLKPYQATRKSTAVSSMTGSNVTVKAAAAASAVPSDGGGQSGSETPQSGSAGPHHPTDPPQPSPAEPEDVLEPEAQVGEQAVAAAAAPAAAAGGATAARNAIEALLGGGAGNLHELLDIPPDADDETMVQLAIALSLQDQAGAAGQAPLDLGAQLQAIQLEAGHLSDTTASGPASEDEDDDDDDDDDEGDDDDEDDDDDDVDEAILAGEAVGVDDDDDQGGPVDHAEGGAGSDSGGSNVDSVSVSGRSSAYGDGGNDEGGVEGGVGGEEQTDILSSDADRLMVDHNLATSSTSAVRSEEEGSGHVNVYQQRVQLSLCVLDNLIQYLPEVKNVSGTCCIPYMQLILSLLTEVDSDTERDSSTLYKALKYLVQELSLDKQTDSVRDIARQSHKHEVLLVTLRLLSVLMSRVRCVPSTTTSTQSTSTGTQGTQSTSTSTTTITSVSAGTSKSITMPPPATQQVPCALSYKTAILLSNGGGMNYCLQVLQTLLEESERHSQAEVEGSVVADQLLKPRVVGSPPDMSPFFLRQYVKGHSTNVFEEYPRLLMEITLRIAYQMKKITESLAADSTAAAVVGLSADAAAMTARSTEFSDTWYKVLAEYMMTSQVSYVKKQVRKLLLYSCGSKEKYRQLRDLHTLDKHISGVRTMCEKRGFDMTSQDVTPVNFSYDTLIGLIDHLKTCIDIAHLRTTNWQKFCHKEEGLLVFLLMASIRLDEGVATLVLQLLQYALCGAKPTELAAASASASSTAAATPAASAAAKGTSAAAVGTAVQASKQRKDKKPVVDVKVAGKKTSSEESGLTVEKESTSVEEPLSTTLVQLVCKTVSKDLLVRFIVCFLLDSNLTSVRWMAHSLVVHIYSNSTTAQRDMLLDLMWSVWPELPNYGCKAAQFVDLLGYFTIKTQNSGSEAKMKLYVEKALTLLRAENKILLNHPNRTIYSALQGLVDFDGYYLERDPCLVCNNPEVPYANAKLSAIKVDSKYTTSTQILKLTGSHNISRISLKITDLKRTKMVRTLNIYYNNRQVQAIVELKNKPGLWHKAKKVILSSGQTEVKIDLPLPIIACNLMIEYADFYDNLQASTETLQCPRCSASVPANPGVCGNCGENVFQCHKCRAINYDEKDPFLCNACGYCKYAKFDFSLSTKPCCAVDPIDTDDDRKKAVTTINQLLEKADNLYKQLQLNKPALEAALLRVADHSVTDEAAVAAGGAAAPTGAAAANAAASAASTINRYIQVVAQKYCVDCKATFEDLGKVIQKVLASRKELVKYDKQRQESSAALVRMSSSVSSSGSSSVVSTPVDGSVRMRSAADSLFSIESSSPRPREKRRTVCYGCATSTVEHCLTLLRAMATNQSLKSYLAGQGLIRELVDYNLRHGSAMLSAEVRQLTCLMSSSNPAVTEQLLTMLFTRINLAITGYTTNSDFAGSVRHEIQLLTNLLQIDDSLWEQRVRCVMKLFMQSIHTDNPVIIEYIALPCLRILQQMIRPPQPTSKKNKDKSLESLYSCNLTSDLHINIQSWLAGETNSSFLTWKKNSKSRLHTASAPAPAAESSSSGAATKKKEDTKVDKKAVRSKFLMEKYSAKWKSNLSREKRSRVPLRLMDSTWLRATIFSPSSSSIRKAECNIIETMCLIPGRKQHILDMLTGFLEDIGACGEAGSEFVALYEKLISSDHWKYYLALKGVLTTITNLLTKEIDELSRLEDTTLSSDLSQGFALQALTRLLSSFLEVVSIKQVYKNRLVGSVLNGYLSLRRLVVQRTKVIDETQEKLLELLEEMTTGTEAETRQFMTVCVRTLDKYPLDDLVSPVFIFERLCSIIYPEANDTAEFFMSLEKDPQQEDFLQGRMVSNPYTSTNPALGPLMRDIKNKICQDCELVALLEDDTGMELLVCNKIISLDLPVKDVHRKIWLAEHNEGEPMRVVYRMRGLLGDATEDMINSLDTRKDEDVDNEEVYKMANEMQKSGGLKVMLIRLAAVRNLGAGKQLMTVLLKLFSYCLKVKANRQELVSLDINSISIMLGALNLALLAEQESGVSVKGQTLTEQILQIMETILLEASSQPPELYKEFSKLCGDKDQLMMLLDRINSPFVRANTNVLQALMRLIPFLAFGDQEKMLALVNHFKPYLDFNRFDIEHTQDEQVHVECFCVIAQGIENNANGRRLKDLICSQSIVTDTLQYLQSHAPHIKAMQVSDGDHWKDFISKASLPYALRLLTGLCKGHEATQVLIGDSVIQILHNMEQISSDEHVGSLAENLLEALKQNEKVAKKIEDVRQQTKAEKKKLAMAMRAKQLGQLGMTANEKGQVTVKGAVLKQMEELKEETGLTCCICREGYRYQPNKVLGIYTFTKKVNLEDAELKPRKTQGYSTVSHFNVIHVDCHLAAVRHARGREEWDSAALQNGNTKCNGLLPLWGPQVPEPAFASCLARHNTYIQECTGVRDATYTYTLHDVKHLLLKFSLEKSFSEESGGGGRESNIQLLPYLMHMTLYVINTTRAATREEKNLSNFITQGPEKWIENSFETEGVLYWTVLALHVLSPQNWKKNCKDLLSRIIVLAHVRQVLPTGGASVTDKTLKAYSVYRPYLLFFGLAHLIQTILFKKCTSGSSDSGWSTVLADYIRNGDQALQEQAKNVLTGFEQELVPCESFSELLDLLGLMDEIPEPETIFQSVLQKLP